MALRDRETFPGLRVSRSLSESKILEIRLEAYDESAGKYGLCS